MTLPAGHSFNDYRGKIAARLAALLHASEGPARLTDAMRHSLMAPAKRVRALLVLVTAREFGGKEPAALDLACALEMVHAASLILDDLPAMDNAELRRGVPANHRVFGEATAILAAIGLLNRSYGVVSECRHLDDSQRTEGVNILHRAIGVQGLVGGQQQDLHDCRTYTDIGDLEAMFGRKTGALFAAAAELGVLAAERSDLGNHLASFGFEVGIAFQILDDVLDAQARRDKAGKDVQQDRDRPNYSIMLGPAEAKQRALAKIRGAVSTVSMLAARNGGSGQLLSMFVEHMSRAFDDILSEPGSLIRAASG